MSNVSQLFLCVVLVGTMQSVCAEEPPWGYANVALQQGVPEKILYAVALQESGLQLKSGKFRPWPWTLNVEGTPERYASRVEAWKAIERHLKNGKTLIDIGVMQVNWHYHKKRLGAPWVALEPYHNIAVGAGILRQAFEKSNDWTTAIGRYHSPSNTPKRKARAERYRKKVLARLDAM
jgi:hypothetical protein